MIRFDVVSLFPEMFNVLHSGIPGRAIKKQQLAIQVWNPRDYATDKHHTVDDRPYGGGPGMVLKIEPVLAAIEQARLASPLPAKVLYLSPQGKTINQSAIQHFAKQSRIILVSGRYEGIDERLHQLGIDEEWSLGDFVMSGGEIAALAIIDSVIRLIPGVLGHEESAKQDSFVDGLLDYPHYTRPENFNGLAVPEVLLSGDHQAIEQWRLKQALGRTWMRRPDLLQKLTLTTVQQQLLNEFIDNLAMRGEKQ